jgi:ornithine cyclodeaminase/alanine dehydrogenase-like protein (mu-crystallin family)
VRSARQAGLWNAGTPPELGEVASGKAVARHGDDDVTICDLTGTGAQDTAIATYALAKCRALRVGSIIAT